MTTAADAKKTSAVEEMRVAQDAVRRYMDESESISRMYFDIWAATSQATLRTAFELQNTSIQAWRTMLDSTAQANRGWIEQAAESVRKNQEATGKVMAAGFDLMESMLRSARV